MRRVKKSVLVPFSTDAMFELVDGIERYPEFLPWCRDARTLETRGDAKTACIDIDFHGVRAHFTTDNVNRRGESIVVTLREGRFATARRVAVPRARARLVQSRIRDRLRVRDARSRDGPGAGLQPRREHADRRLRPSRRIRLRRQSVKVTVTWATREVQDSVDVDLPAGATVAEAVDASGLVGQYGIDRARLGFAVYGRRAFSGDGARRRRPDRSDAAARGRPQSRADRPCPCEAAGKVASPRAQPRSKR
jgi:putative ubiquitin-RnfH superfamily antitoxin RatB of RatAB toxin-antitoxin module